MLGLNHVLFVCLIDKCRIQLNAEDVADHITGNVEPVYARGMADCGRQIEIAVQKIHNPIGVALDLLLNLRRVCLAICFV